MSKDWLEITKETKVTRRESNTVRLDRNRLGVLLQTAGVDLPDDVKVKVVGIPYQGTWELEDFQPGRLAEHAVHLVVSWETVTVEGEAEA